MKHFTLFMLFGFLSFAVKAQETVLELSMQPGYTQEIYLDFNSGEAQNFDVNAWDIAFYRMSSFEIGERVNDGLGIEVYEMSTNPEDWNVVTPADIDENTPQYYNSDTEWTLGAFDRGGNPDDQFSFGWADYNPGNHHLEGNTVFILAYPDGSYKQVFFQEFYGGYNFKYSEWNDTDNNWENEQEVTVSNSEGEGQFFNFYSLTNHEVVEGYPTIDNWDLVFQKYVTDLEVMMYPVQGALQNPNAVVAINTNENAEESDLEFSEDINTVGYDWKNFDGSAYVVDPDTYYFLKREDGTVYRFHFLSFEGTETGNFSLGYEDVTENMDIESFDKNNSFSIYPNPTTDRNINLLYEDNRGENALVEVYDLIGRKVKSIQLSANGYSNHSLNLEHLSAGTYLVKFQSGEFQTTKKLILQ